jgi:adenine deaminase
MKKEALRLGVSKGIDPFMTLAFISLPVIPDIRLTTRGLVKVDFQEVVPTIF